MKAVHTLLIGTLLAAPLADAKLPPPTPEQLAAQQESKAREESRLAQEKLELERAQDRVVERYRKEHGQGAGGVNASQLPNNTKQGEGHAPPEGGDRQSAEAHSAPAK